MGPIHTQWRHTPNGRIPVAETSLDVATPASLVAAPAIRLICPHEGSIFHRLPKVSIEELG